MSSNCYPEVEKKLPKNRQKRPKSWKNNSNSIGLPSEMTDYLKVYPTFDVLGAQFGIDRSKACKNVQALLPILCKALKNLGVLPHREFKTVEEFRAACDWVEELLIDATERPHSRPTDNKKQRDLYSGKKKRHMLKNTIMATVLDFG